MNFVPEGPLDFFEVNERPVVVDRTQGVGWVWSRGAWQNSPDVVEECYSQGHRMEEDVFVGRFPFAALALIEYSSRNTA